MKPDLKAFLTCAAFTVFFIVGLMISKQTSDILTPLSIFFLILIVNTYFSIKLFAQLTPMSDHVQNLMDALLVVLYALLAYGLRNALLFTSILTIVFVVATFKYVLLKRVIDHPRLLKNKTWIDATGVLMCLIAVCGTFFGYEVLTSWFLAIVFGVANIFLLFVKPMYRI